MNENKAFIREIATEIGDSHVRCKMCQKMAVHYEASNHQGYGLNECLIFQCPHLVNPKDGPIARSARNALA